MRRLAVLGATAALAATAFLTPVGSPAGAAPAATAAAAAQAKEVSTRFAMHARGLGTKLRSDDLPVGSGATASRTINCTNIAGKKFENFVAQVNLPNGLGTVNGVRTRVWTAKKGNQVSSNASQTIAGITLLEAGDLKLQVTGLKSRTKAWHDGSGYHVSSKATVLGLKLTVAGQEIPIEIPTPGQPIEIPGLLKLNIGVPKERVTQRSAYTALNALDIQINGLHTRLKAGYSRVRIAEGVAEGLFQGHSAGIEANVLDPLVKVGKTPLSVMPCEGTGGEVQRKTTVGVDIPQVLDLGAVEVTQSANQRRGEAWGWENAEIADVNLLGGALRIEVVRARAEARRKNGKLTTKAITSTARIFVNGEPTTIPIDDPIEIPGIALIDPRVVKKIKGGVEVIALQIKLLDGSLATINLGIAKMRIHRTAR
ncbi:MAG TPA: choice-of-anchor P family protein [Nocardioides sp.]|nr:choice-of-anchor P family protein [Nocardioides sp.]